MIAKSLNWAEEEVFADYWDDKYLFGDESK